MGSLTQLGRCSSLESGEGSVHRLCCEVPYSDEVEAVRGVFYTVRWLSNEKARRQMVSNTAEIAAYICLGSAGPVTAHWQ